MQSCAVLIRTKWRGNVGGLMNPKNMRTIGFNIPDDSFLTGNMIRYLLYHLCQAFIYKGDAFNKYINTVKPFFYKGRNYTIDEIYDEFMSFEWMERLCQ